jgi:hypothetical protein
MTLSDDETAEVTTTLHSSQRRSKAFKLRVSPFGSFFTST